MAAGSDGSGRRNCRKKGVAKKKTNPATKPKTAAGATKKTRSERKENCHNRSIDMSPESTQTLPQVM